MRMLVRMLGFNEAEAHRLGKHVDGIIQGEPRGYASMRPRLIASENLLGAALHEVTNLASMRPRLIASENFYTLTTPSAYHCTLQ